MPAQLLLTPTFDGCPERHSSGVHVGIVPESALEVSQVNVSEFPTYPDAQDAVHA